jgi:hypothetical protein
MTQDVHAPEQQEEQERRRRPWFLIPWILLVFLILFCCGQVALLSQLRGSGEDTRSELQADYQPWAFVPMAPIDPNALLEALGLNLLTPIPTLDGCLLLGQNCDGTPTQEVGTPVPGTPGTVTPTITPTATATIDPSLTPTNEPPTITPTITNTPTVTPTPTPLVHPLKWGSPRDVQPGINTPVNFTILIINGRSGPATLTRVTDCLPAGMSFVSASPAPTGVSSPGGCAAGETEVRWVMFQTLLPGRFYRIQMATMANAPAVGGVLENLVVAEGDFTASSYWTSIYAWTPTPTPVDVTPVAVDDNATTAEDPPAPGLTINVLANDSGLTNPPLTVAIVAGPSHGLAVPVGTSIQYTPDPNYNNTMGPESFTYTITDVDGDVSNVATVRIDVTPVNDPPVVVADGPYVLDEDTSLTVPSVAYPDPRGLLWNDTDVEAPPEVLSAILNTGPANGVLMCPSAPSLSICPDGSFRYAPNPDYRGLDSFTYHVNDGSLNSNVATVTLTVTPANDVPVVNADSTTTLEDTAALISVLANDILGDDPALGDYSVALSVETAPTNGTAVVVGTSIRYTPNPDYRGPDSLVYRVTESPQAPETQDSRTGVVSITVTPVNDVPEAYADSASVAEDPPAPGLTLNVLANDDLGNANLVGDQPVRVAIVPLTGPSNGTAMVNGDNTITYMPNPNYYGPDSFRYTVTDAWPVPAYPPEVSDTSNQAAVSITVTPVNDVPVANPDSRIVIEDAAWPGVTIDVVANDTDVEGAQAGLVPEVNPATVSIVTGPSNGVLVNVSGGNVSYLPNLDFRGTDSFTYTVQDYNVPPATSNVATVTVTVTPVNDEPDAVDDYRITAEDTAVTISVLANDDLGDDPLVGDQLVRVEFPVGGLVPQYGIAVINADNTITYTPNANWNGTDSFSYVVRDAQGPPFYPPEGSDVSLPATVTVDVTPVNDAPVAVGNGPYGVTEDAAAPLTVPAPGVLGNDTDVDLPPQVLTAILDVAPVYAAAGGFSLNADGSFTYLPAADYRGPDSFTYHAYDGLASSNVVTVTLDVTPVDDVPVANPDSATTPEDTYIDIPVLANDSGLGDTPLALTVVSGPSNGTAAPAGGSIRYTPAANYFGSDSFTYTITDTAYGPPEVSDTSAPAAVSVTVTSANDPPVALPDGPYSVSEDPALPFALWAPGVLANDTDVDLPPQVLTAVLDVGPTHAAAGGFTLNPDGSFTYMPEADYRGLDSFTYHANDGLADSNVVTVRLNVTPVNDVPVANPDSATTLEDTWVMIPVLANDSGFGDTPLALTVVSGPSHGTAWQAGTSIRYRPDLNYNDTMGLDSFTYTITDTAFGFPEVSETSAPATVTVDVTPVNDVPVALGDGPYGVSEDPAAPLTVVAPGVLSNDTDPEVPPQVLSAVLDTGPAHAVVGGFTLNANGSFTYMPEADYRGPDSFTYHANDGVADSNLVTVTIDVTPVNDTPDAYPDSATTSEDTPLNVAPPGVLGNDTGIGDTPLTLTVVSGPTDGGALTLNDDGSYSYTPRADFNGISTFGYRVTDTDGEWSEATVTVNVTSVDDAPTANPDTASTPEDTLLNVGAPGVLGNDTGLGDTPLTVAVISGPTDGGSLTLNNDGSFSYMPTGDFNGVSSFVYRVTDADADSSAATVSITVMSVNDPPVALPDGPYTVSEDPSLPLGIWAPGVLGNDSDVDLPPQVLSAVLDSGPAHAALGGFTLNANGSFTYLPEADYRGPDSFTYHANDGLADSNVVTVTLIVTPVDDLPVAVDDSPSTPEDVPITIDVLGNDTGLGDTPLLVAVTSPPTNGGAVVNGDNTITYTPGSNYNGTDAFEYTVTDATGGPFAPPELSQTSAPASVTVTVTPVNDPPVAVADGPFATPEDNLLSVASPGVLGNDSDVDDLTPPPWDTLSAVLDTGPSHAAVGGFSLNADGSFTYLPDANYNGPDSFTYHASDGAADSSVVTVTLDVTPVNDAPSAANDSYSGNEDALLAVGAPGVLGNDSDVDDLVPPPWDGLTAVLSTGPAHGSVLLNADGSFTYTPDFDYYGGDSFTYVANDGFLDSSPATVTLTVNPVPPVLFVDAVATQPTANVGETGAFFTVAWGNLGPDDAPGAALDIGLTGPCTLISPAFPIALGTIAEGDGGFQDVTVRADAVGTCQLTATLTSTRSNPPPSSASIDITAPLPPGFITGLLTSFGLSGPEGGPAPGGSVEPEVAAPTPTALETGPALPSEPTAQPTPPEPVAPETPAPEPTPTPLVVSQGTLMADPGNPLAWGILTLFGIWFGRMLVFKVHVPTHRTRRNAHYDEPATRPSRGR